ncbi:MAG: cobalamin-dependent protein [Peptococcaceae bacterium]|nr:cobalamin-dependent protein [Peptococcaceae bacterium]
MNLFDEIGRAVMEGDEYKAAELCQAMLAESFDPVEIISQGLLPGMDAVEADYRGGVKYIPEILMSARAILKAMDQIANYLGDRGLPKLDKVIIGTVKGDIHDIGKQLVKIILESAGFSVIDLGTNVTKEEFIEEIRKSGASVVLISAMLTTTLPNMKEVAEAIQKTKFDRPVSVLVGGNPVTKRFAREINAIFSDSAVEAKEIVTKIMRSEQE